MNLFLYDKPITRVKMIDAYQANMVEYLKLHHPEADEAQLQAFVHKVISDRAKPQWEALQQARKQHLNINDVARQQQLWPTIRVIKAVDPNNPKSKKRSYGNLVEFKDMDMLEFCNDYRDKIVSPFGSVYETTDKQTSFLTNKIIKDGAKRKHFKKLMLKARKAGDATVAHVYNNQQASVKINMNSTSGAMGCNGNFLSYPANYNSITSIARFFIMNAYGHAERFLESNFYFRNYEQVENFIVTCCRLGPSDEKILSAVNKLGLHIPSAQEVGDFIVENFRKYTFDTDYSLVYKLLEHVSTGKLTYMFYMSNMKHLVMKNDQFFRPWMEDILSDKNVDYSKQWDLDEINKIDNDLLIVLSTVYNDKLPKNKKGNNISIQDCLNPQPEQGVPQAHPEVVNEFINLAKHMQAKLDEIDEVFELFMHCDVGIGYIIEHKNMYRNAVVLSDTDSIIFTTKSWVQWFNGDLKINDRAFAINALVVYWLSKATAALQYQVSIAFCACGKDLLTMNMKNEFMMPIEILTSLKKHYASILKIQEGVVFNQPRLDIKGVGLRGSTFSSKALTYAQWFIASLIDDLYKHGEVDPDKKIQEVLEFERMVYDDMSSGKTTFLSIESIKNPEEYSDAERSIYFNYRAWQEIFAQNYGSILLPTKTYVVPLANFHDAKYYEYLRRSNPDIADKYKQFCDKLEKTKKVTRMPINSTLPEVPKELLKVADIRGTVYNQSKPLYLIMKSLGITVGNDMTRTVLFSDVYGWVTKEEGERAKQRCD